MAKEKRYENKDPSVTQVLGVLRKIGLEFWFKKNTAQFCNDASNKGKEIGKQIHEAIQGYITTGEAKVATQYGDEVMTALKSFMLFKKEHPEFHLENSELKMHSKLYSCNGTLDCKAVRIEPALRRKTILDWKSGECKHSINKEGEGEFKYEVPPVYDEMRYQLSAYVNFYNEIYFDDIKEAYILVLAKDKIAYNLVKMEEREIHDCFHEVFIPALKIYNYQKENK